MHLDPNFDVGVGRSQVGAGTVFTFTLPTSDSPRQTVNMAITQEIRAPSIQETA